MFKFQTVIKSSIKENMDYYKWVLFGLKQTGKQWVYEIPSFLMKIRFIQCNSDNCLISKYKNNKLCFTNTLY